MGALRMQVVLELICFVVQPSVSLDAAAAERAPGRSTMHETVLNYRHVVGSTDLDVYRSAAKAVRFQMMKADPYRPLYHFTGVESWINDPDGPIYYKGKYHLFYQFDPMVDDGKGGWRRSARCWGHAMSTDLVHWEDWPVALWPDSPHDRGGVYSGNTFVHEEKIHGLYTGNVGGRRESYGILAWSDDGGVMFKKKMVMDNLQRPSAVSPVHWDAQIWKEGDIWCQLVGGAELVNGKQQGAAMLWKSRDLENWTFQKNIAPSIRHQEYWELPYLVPLDGRHVFMVGAGNPYWIGRYDAKAMAFTAETPVRQVDTGHYYSFNPHMVDDKGPGGAERRLMHGWARIGKPPAIDGVPYWEQAHSIPRVLTLKGDRLWQEPIPELQCLRQEGKTLEKLSVSADKPVQLKEIRGDALELTVTVDRGTAKRCGLRVRADPKGNGMAVWCDVADGFGIEKAGHKNVLEAGASVTLRIFIDRGVLEVYCGGLAVTHTCFAPAEKVEVFAFSEGGDATFTRLDAWKMKPMWE